MGLTSAVTQAGNCLASGEPQLGCVSREELSPRRQCLGLRPALGRAATSPHLPETGHAPKNETVGQGRSRFWPSTQQESLCLLTSWTGAQLQVQHRGLLQSKPPQLTLASEPGHQQQGEGHQPTCQQSRCRLARSHSPAPQSDGEHGLSVECLENVCICSGCWRLAGQHTLGRTSSLTTGPVVAFTLSLDHNRCLQL